MGEDDQGRKELSTMQWAKGRKKRCKNFISIPSSFPFRLDKAALTLSHWEQKYSEGSMGTIKFSFP